MFFLFLVYEKHKQLFFFFILRPQVYILVFSSVNICTERQYWVLSGNMKLR